MPEGELIHYTTEDGATRFQLRAVDGTAWLTRAQMAELFQATKQNINVHIHNVLDDGKLTADSVVKEYFTTAADGKGYRTKHYSLDMILAVGYRVRSLRGVQFRRWATTTLKNYLVKGFAMDDARLRDPAWGYFDELLERIRDIRASEARFYQKVRDTLALSMASSAATNCPGWRMLAAPPRPRTKTSPTNDTLPSIPNERKPNGLRLSTRTRSRNSSGSPTAPRGRRKGARVLEGWQRKSVGEVFKRVEVAIDEPAVAGEGVS